MALSLNKNLLKGIKKCKDLRTNKQPKKPKLLCKKLTWIKMELLNITNFFQ